MKALTIFFCLLAGLSETKAQEFHTVDRGFNPKKVNLHRSEFVSETTETPVINPIVLADSESDSGMAVLFSPPLDRMVATSGFGYRKDPFVGSRQFHSGIDLQSNKSEVYGMLPGKVIETGYDSKLGRYIKIRHGQYLAIYGHLNSIFVSPEDFVRPGMLIGITGSTGRSTGDHLHLSIKKGDQPIHPLLFLKAIHMVKSKEDLLNLLTP
ncbi:hypothetical protein P872_06075 [Rhodonellum psychrophilum GCM71 = DSM 17998]|uniref:M23ase beta-sheet core domain-containing protein n=2 Tax=Rhodonellum TaxID=336827 RepID=U5BYW2_9BACT|nr:MULTISPECIES: M23 family metallopeptidase [Rhodonellum]ERM83038.1 hypothetical protein P872_06075 [Rhodonellum psychrophilum GCM71 = DSM 17998]SDZ47540.1 Murein DD-endopeptidase MepM and murein hydrolase activator NlpD, contain LysM domain [Rhodonellum ikkaensis]